MKVVNLQLAGENSITDPLKGLANNLVLCCRGQPHFWKKVHPLLALAQPARQSLDASYH